MLVYSGECHCGNVKLLLTLSEPLEQYTPRQCDCEFCLSRKIVYLSHPEAKLVINTQLPLLIQQQGSNQSSFLTCGHCESVIAASIKIENKLIGALNAILLVNSSSLQSPVFISPKLLTPKEKVKRWEAVWLTININEI